MSIKLDDVRPELLAGESVLATLSGQSLDGRGKRNTVGLLVLTDRRVLYRGSLVFQKESHTFNLGDVNSVSMVKGALLGGVEVAVAGGSIKVGAAAKKDCAAFVSVANDVLARRGRAGVTPAPSSSSVADELLKLAALRETGVLSDAEFEAQKARLLG